MARHHLVLRIVPAALCVLVATSGAARAQESLQSAQALYSSAAYDEALAMLDRLQPQATVATDQRSLQQNRALCLLALGRTDDAEMAIAAAVNADPTYRGDQAGASPRVRAVFKDVRSRLLPGLIQSRYNDGRALYDKQSWSDAARAFRDVLALSSDPDLTDAQLKTVGEYKVLSEGFLKLAEAAAAPPPAPAPALEPVAAPAPPAPAPAPVTPAPSPVDYDRVFESTDAAVTAPVPLRQDMPRWVRSALPLPAPGTIEVVIAKDGTVERAAMVQGVASFYDRQVIDNTKNWRYRPAMFDGRPVRYKKQIRITIQSE